MLENPQTIINVSNNIYNGICEDLQHLPDAIYIPFLARACNLNELLSELSWYEGEIIILITNNITGCLVNGFPDTSVIGHIEQKNGNPYYPFLSGNFLFINPYEAEGFFPLIYNEDWLFMIPAIIKKRISAIGVIHQKRYNP